ncbi:hypothetical protein BU15DRAFT_66921 [Melanogaster broomeanus]|nr:hypothetical protein BU15DRAFT_66921 [Melanogaster broomeanus]
MALSPVYIVRAFRIYFRIKIGRFWWEDGWAAIMLLSGILWMISQWAFLLTNGSTSMVFSWTYMIAFTCIVTAGRMSILFSIIRIIHGSPRLKNLTYLSAVFFVACSVILIVEKAGQCATNRSWEQVLVSSENLFCRVNAQTSVFQFTTDGIAVLMLVVLPLCMLWKVKLPRRQRRMILSIFASSIVMAIGALFHTIGQALNDLLVMTAGVNVEVTARVLAARWMIPQRVVIRMMISRGQRDNPDDNAESDDGGPFPELGVSGQV